MKLEQILKVAIRGGASDLILKVGSAPRFRYHGKLVSLSDGGLISAEAMNDWVHKILPSHLIGQLTEKGDADFGYLLAAANVRLRVNVFRQSGQLGMAMRIVSYARQSWEDLKLPKIVGTVATKKRGLVLVTGATGSGKSTTLAGVVQEINRTRAAHIITIEDPIEFLYKDELATINQREIGVDAPDFATALRASLRQNPDIILVGELRDEGTIRTALMAAETGHLVLSTLHTQDAVNSLTRIMSYFPPHEHNAVRMQLANCLQMVISQRLVPRADHKGRVVACEVLVVNSFVNDVILNGEHFATLTDAIRKGGKTYGMQTFDQSLLKLYNASIISKEQALSEASSKENMKLLMSGVDHETT